MTEAALPDSAMSRRRFLGASAAVGAGLLVPDWTWAGVTVSSASSTPASFARRASSPINHIPATAGEEPAATVSLNS